ncbi:MAG: ATP-dependent helicase HrpB [Bacteroidota bacterium]
MTYPVLEVVEEVKQNLRNHRTVILQAPPGAGKSTILPLQLWHEPWLNGKKTIMLEPRRLAARSVAMRMADLVNEDVGATVGYRVRFETKVSARTKLEVVTEGILTRMIQHDNSLDDVGLVIFDEFHERSLQADLALALSLQVQQVLRDDLRILIMSATLDGDKLSRILKAPMITSEGRQFPVTHRYVVPDAQAPLAVSVAKTVRKALQEQPGDILVFLPGAGEIRRTADLLEAENLSASLFELYGDLPYRQQQEAILPHPQGKRKIILATSIAETSLTIEGITTVVDGGYSRVPRFDPRSGLTRLETVRVTKDAADQRAGRAGRLGPGVCYRLWSEGTQANLVASRSPEILEADLAPLVLELAQWGVKNIFELTWITPPPAGAVNQARELLQELEALENDRITERGKEMLDLPTHPRMAHMLLTAKDDQLAVATDVAALLEERDPLPRGSGADLSLRLEALRKWRSGVKAQGENNVFERIEKLAAAWRRLMNVRSGNSIVSDADVGALIMAAYPERIARQAEKHSERYKLANGRMARLPDHDPLTREPWLAIAQLDAGMGEGKIFLAAPLHEDDLAPLTHEKEIVKWDDERNMLAATLERRIGNLLLSSRPLTKISEELRIKIICSTLREKGLSMLNWDDTQKEWQARIMSIRQWRTQERWPDVSDEALLDALEDWLAPFLGNAYKQTDLQRLDLNSALIGILPWDLNNKLDALAPQKIKVPSGSMIKLQYFIDGRPPVMEVRLQEVFGLLETPTVNEGRNKIMLHLLSPGYKPVQVTQDLKSFWTNTYSEVRKELRMRYPKHSWPEDPWTAEAVRGVKKKIN